MTDSIDPKVTVVDQDTLRPMVTEDTAAEINWPINLVGGTMGRSFRRYLRLAGLISLGTVASIIIGVVIGLLAGSGDVGVLTTTLLFVVNAFAILICVKRRVSATLQFGDDSVGILCGKRAIANWFYAEIQGVHSKSLSKGIGLAAAIPSGVDKVTVEYKNGKCVFEMNHDVASHCIEALKVRTKNAIYIGTFDEVHVPNDSDRADQVWRVKLRSEFRSAFSLVAFGLFGSAFLGLFIYGILSRQWPNGPLGVIIFMFIAAVSGPFLLYSGIKGLVTWFIRRRKFSILSKQNENNAINELLAELYDQ